MNGAYRAMREAGEARHRDDPTRPLVRAWKDAVERFGLAWTAAVPPGLLEEWKALRRGEDTAITESIAFLEADPVFFRSGYFKAELIALLKRRPLSWSEAERLGRIVLAIVDRRDGREFRHYCRLARRLDRQGLEVALGQRLGATDPAIRRRAAWMLAAIRQPP